MFRVVTVAACLVALLRSVERATHADAFECYVCNSRRESGCGSPPSQDHLKTCEALDYANRVAEDDTSPPPFTVCRTQVIHNGSEEPSYDRRCGWIKHNENRETCLITADPIVKATNCECHTERCNGATSIAANPVLLITTAFAAAAVAAAAAAAA